MPGTNPEFPVRSSGHVSVRGFVTGTTFSRCGEAAHTDFKEVGFSAPCQLLFEAQHGSALLAACFIAMFFRGLFRAAGRSGL
jgi:hypothetical protein